MIAVFKMLLPGEAVRGYIHIDIHIIFYPLLPSVGLGKTQNKQALHKNQQPGRPEMLL
jgi:hypothetical protein